MHKSRIRYEKTIEEGKFRSVRKYTHPDNGAVYRVVLDTNESQWLVLDDASSLVARSGRMQNLARMKQEAKKALASLGVEFEKESRERDNDDSASAESA